MSNYREHLSVAALVLSNCKTYPVLIASLTPRSQSIITRDSTVKSFQNRGGLSFESFNWYVAPSKSEVAQHKSNPFFKMSSAEETKQEEFTEDVKSTVERVASSPQSRRRTSHIETLLKVSRESLARFDLSIPEDEENMIGTTEVVEEGGEVTVAPPSEREKKFHNLRKRLSVYQERVPERLVEVRIKDYSYYIPLKADAPTVKTVANQSICYAAYEFFRRIHQYRKYRQSLRGSKDPKRRRSSRWGPVTASDIFLPFDKKPILSEINLVLKPGRTYVVLGPPASGKTTLLSAIAGRLPVRVSRIDGKPLKDRPHQEGRIEYNGVCPSDDPSLVLPNVVSFVGQLDIHAPYLTVKETFDFAFQSRTGGKHENLGISSEHLAAELDEQRFTENLTIEGLDLSVCADTFVGNSDVRGVSGGQRRRVTVGGTLHIQELDFV
jgi:energy-coupling factor transporter ATP-binding protein EcfA2